MSWSWLSATDEKFMAGISGNEELRYPETMAKQKVLHIVIPNSVVRMKAIEIARTGNSQNGYPGITDSLYHSWAILNDVVFITNNKKHIKKVKAYGYIQQLFQYSCSAAS